MAVLISCSVTCSLPTLTRVELPMPNPILPDPKLLMSVEAKPMRIITKKAGTTAVPLVLFDKRRREVSIEFLRTERQFGSRFTGEPCRHQGGAARAAANRGVIEVSPRKLVAGNWKMHGRSSDISEIAAIAAAAEAFPDVDVALCVPAILIERAVRAVPGFAIGGQDVHQFEKGAHTGCTSAQMLRDAGAGLTIVGHSERRDAQRESDAEVKAKAEAALANGLGVILCVGESLDVREAGRAVDTV